MTRTVIERQNAALYVYIIFAIIFIVLGVILLIDISVIYALVIFIGAIISLTLALSVTRSEKEMIIIEDSGLTLNGGVNLGPIPWDCISGVNTHRVIFDKTIYIYLANAPKLKDIFGEDIIYKKVNRDKKTNEIFISMDLDLCKLKGIDLEALIKRYMGGHRGG